VAVALNDRQQNGHDDAREEYGGDQAPVADVFVRHVDAGERQNEKTNCDEEEEALQGQGVVGFWGGCVGRFCCRGPSWLRRGRGGRERLFLSGGIWGCFVGRFVLRGRLSDRDDTGLLLVDLGEHDGPGGRFVAAATRGFVEAEGLESSRKSEEEQRRGDEDADVEMDQANVFQKGVRRGHVLPFYTKSSNTTV